MKVCFLETRKMISKAMTTNLHDFDDLKSRRNEKSLFSM